MNAALLLLSATGALAPEAARLHPAAAELFLELPDLSGLRLAYPEAPLARAAREEAVRGLLRQTIGEEEIDLLAWLGGGDAHLLESVRSASLSFSSGRDGRPPAVLVALVLDSEDGARGAERALRRVAGVPETGSIPTPLPGLEAWTRVEGGTLYLGGGGLASGDLPPAASLAEDPAYLAGRSKLGEAGGTSVLAGYIVGSPRALLSEALARLDLPFSVPAGSPGRGSGTSSWSMNLQEGRFVTEVFSSGAGGSPLLGGSELAPAWIEPVPPGTMFFWSTALEGAGLEMLFRQRFSSVLEELEARVGFGLGDLFAAAGPGLVVYAMPVQGLALPETFLSIELDPEAGDAEKLRERLEALCQALAANIEGMEVQTRDYRVKDERSGERVPIPVSTIQMPPDVFAEVPLPLRPAFCVAGGRLLVSPIEMHLKRELKRLHELERAEGSHPLDAHGFVIPSGATSIVYMDWGALIDGVVRLVRTMAGMMGGADLPIDLAAIPESGVVTQHLRPTLYVGRSVEGGTRRRIESSFGPEVVLGPLALWMRGLPTGGSQEEAAAPVEADHADESR